jgi:hypothetical protein
MHPCSTCKRHIRGRELTCPFCGTAQRSTEPSSSVTLGAFALTLAVLGTAACSTDKSAGDTAGTTTQGSSTEGSTTVDDTSDSGMTSTETDTDDAPTDTSASAGSFYAGPDDDLSSGPQCDPWLQDCPEGEKCVPYASHGGSWDANKCVPILGDGEPGDACTYAGSVVATDDCDGSSTCWSATQVDGEWFGVCTAFCTNSPDDAQCADGHSCLITSSGSITLCVADCDPLVQDCADTLGCYWANTTFACLPRSQDIPVGEPCGYLNDCAPGSFCLAAELVNECAGVACCAEYCSIAEPLCATPGSECVSFFAGDPPAGFEDVGLCVVPE